MDISQGSVGEEALALLVYCVLKYPKDIKKTLIAAVNHDEDSDSTGGITGNMMGTYLSVDFIPSEWASAMEVKPGFDENLLSSMVKALLAL